MIPGTLVVDPTRPSTLYVGSYDRGRLRKSTDGGSTWTTPSTSIQEDLGVYALAIDPQNPSTLYGGSFGGVLKSADSGSTWSLASGADLGGVFVTSLPLTRGIRARSTRGPTAGESSGAPMEARLGAISTRASLTSTYVSALDRPDRHEAACSVVVVFTIRSFSGALTYRWVTTRHVFFTDPDGHLVFRTIDSSGNSPAPDPTALQRLVSRGFRGWLRWLDACTLE
jgi:hypothetical protein